jgi:hypothetical protein
MCVVKDLQIEWSRSEASFIPLPPVILGILPSNMVDTINWGKHVSHYRGEFCGRQHTRWIDDKRLCIACRKSHYTTGGQVIHLAVPPPLLCQQHRTAPGRGGCIYSISRYVKALHIVVIFIKIVGATPIFCS